MRNRASLLAVLLTALALLPADNADAQRRRHGNWQQAHHDRVAARRAGVVAGAITYGIARSAQNSRNEEEFQRCLDYSGDYYYCDEQFRQDRYHDQRAARRAAIGVGVTTRAIVRHNQRHDHD